MRIRDFNPPPTYTDLFYRWIGIPRSTGLDIYVGDYPYGVGLSVGKRMRYRFPSRQGLAGKLITPAQTVQRQHFRAALDIWAEQPTYTPFNITYGTKGRNWWWLQSSGLGWFTIDYFMHLQLPHEIQGTPACWDPHHYLNIFAMEQGTWWSVKFTPPLPQGTYRVTLEPSWFHNGGAGGGYITAVRVFEGVGDVVSYDRGAIGDWDPSDEWYYGSRWDWSATPEDAWSRYQNDSLHTYRDVNLENNHQVGIKFDDTDVHGAIVLTGALQIKVQKL